MSRNEWFRPEILSLPAYVPGGVIDNPDIIKLASNEVPFPTLPAVEAVVAGQLGTLNRYPDMFATGLSDALASFHEWDGGIVIGNGSTSLIEKILQAVTRPGGEIVYAWRSFEAYPIAVQAAGGTSIQVPLTAEFAHDLGAMADAITEATNAVLLCSPNNPTGVALTHSELASFLARVPARVPVLLDEAYIDFAEMDDAVDSLALAREYPNLIVLRTFSKAYGLCGLRCGYALCSEEFAGPLGAIMTPFGVNSLAQVAAVAALRSQTEVRQRVEWVKRERARFVSGVRELGFTVPETHANFLWIPTSDTQPIVDACESEHVRVRPFPGEGVRISIGEATGTEGCSAPSHT